MANLQSQTRWAAGIQRMWPWGLCSHRRGKEQRGTGGLTGQMTSGHSAHLAHRLLLGRRTHSAVQCVVGVVISRKTGRSCCVLLGKLISEWQEGNRNPGSPLVPLVCGKRLSGQLWCIQCWCLFYPQPPASSGTGGGRCWNVPGTRRGGVGATGLQVCSCCWTCGNGGKLFVLRRKWVMFLHRGPSWHILGLVTHCKIHFLPAPGSRHRVAAMPGCSSAQILFHKPITTLLVSRWIHFCACRTLLIGSNNWLNTVNAIKSLAALSPQASRINQFLRAGCALAPQFSTQQSKTQAPQQHLSHWFSWLLDSSCHGCLLCHSHTGRPQAGVFLSAVCWYLGLSWYPAHLSRA